MCCDETLRCLRPLCGETQRLFLSQPRAQVGSGWDPGGTGSFLTSLVPQDLEGKIIVDELKQEVISTSSKAEPPQCTSLAWSADGQVRPWGPLPGDPHWGRGPLPGTLTGAGDLPSPGDPHWGGGRTPGDPSHGEKDLGNEGSGDPSLGQGDLGMGGSGTLLLSRKWGFGDSAPGVAPGRTWWPPLPFPHRGLGVRIGPGATWVIPVLVPRPCSPATPTTWCGCGR